MNDSLNVVVDLLRKKFEKKVFCYFSKLDDLVINVEGCDLIDLCYFLRNNHLCFFDQLIDICGVDYLFYKKSNWSRIDFGNYSRAISDFNVEKEPDKRFVVVYHLLSIKNNHRVRIKVYLNNDSLYIPSVIDIWPSSNWYEREVFDMYGIIFTGHPNLKRILTDYGFKDYPLRKDFPLEGKTEIRYDNDKCELVYEPVSISERCLIPKVIYNV